MSIKVDKVEEGLPISVVIPLGQKRKPFFYDYVLPMIEANNPIEIIINNNEGTAPKKRNEGFGKATQPYVFFCDDDCILPVSYFQSLYDCLEAHPDKSYAYSGYRGVVFNPTTEPHNNFIIPGIEFTAEMLRRQNFINTTSLIRTKDFPGFDENIKRFQDWDLWLTMLEQGKVGILVPSQSFLSFFNDEGQTNVNNSYVDAFNIIKNKHSL
jgi:hypothetical protein